MKKLKCFLLFFISIVCIVGCKYDDEDLWNKIDSLEKRIAALEEKLSSLNKDISSISTIVNALQDNVTVTNIEEGENGYTITFSNDKKITIRDGKDGEDGTSGEDVPIIGIDLFEGKYYWTQTINSVKTWLTDEAGDKIPVTGESGITPRLKVSAAGYWMVSYDNGISYSQLLDEKGKPVLAVGKDGSDGKDGNDGKDGINGEDGADGEDGKDGKDGDSFFKDVKVEGKELVLVLKDGTVLRLPYTGGEEISIETVTAKGSVNLDDTDGLTVLSLVGDSKLSQKQFSIDVISNTLPQLLFVTDDKENVIMMSRGYFQETSAEINVQSTTLALISIMPQLVVKTKEDFQELSTMILKSSHFSKVKEEVEKCVKAKKDIFDTNNTDLFQNIETLINGLLGKTQTRSFEHIAGIETSPLDVKAEGNTVAIRNVEYYPPYECSLSYGGERITDRIIHTTASFGVMDLIKGTWGKNRYGTSTDFTLIYQGEYNFYCDKATPEACKSLVSAMLSDLFSMIGFDKDELKEFEKLKFTIELLSKLGSYVSSMYAGTLSEENIVDPFIDAVCSFLMEKAGEFDLKMPLKGESIKVSAKTIQRVYNVLKGYSQIQKRFEYAYLAPNPVEFDLCNYSEITCCTNVSLTKVEKTDNQKGKPEQLLAEPIEVVVTSTAEDGTPILNDYYKVKFEVTAGYGGVANPIADIDENGLARTSWMLGASGAQQVRAVVINSITNTEISDPVVFTATLDDDDESKGDRQALIEFYNATGGDNWDNNTNWCSDKPLNEWFGVKTNGSGRVIELNFVTGTQRGNNLTGDADLRKLTALEKIDCSFNTLTGLNASRMKNLVELTCWDNEITNLNVLGSTNLQKLYCEINQLTSLDVSTLVNLKVLSCYRNKLSSIDVSSLKNLESLECSENNLSVLDISGLYKLQHVWCHDQNITKIYLSFWIEGYFSYDSWGEKNDNLYQYPDFVNGYQYPQFIYR